LPSDITLFAAGCLLIRVVSLSDLDLRARAWPEDKYSTAVRVNEDGHRWRDVPPTTHLPFL